MTMSMPMNPKIYHILHADRIPSLLTDEYLWCDAEVIRRSPPGTTIGMNAIKRRRLEQLTLASHPDLHVGDCVPFYFCPRSIMLYVIHQANHPDLAYHGGQDPIVHLELDLHAVVAWADSQGLRWAFTLSNAGARYFEDYADLERLSMIEWDSVQAIDWRACKEGKQAEFLIENRVPWGLISRIGVLTGKVRAQVEAALRRAPYKPEVEILPEWYYP
jgi:hypothetical protein